MPRRSPGAVWLGASFITLTLAGFGVVAAFVLFPDPLPFFEQHWYAFERYRGQEEVQVQLARRFHWRGDEEPCLRYRSALPGEEQEVVLAHRLVSAGYAPVAERLHQLVRRWEMEHQGHHHLLDHHQERLLLLDEHLHGLERAILRLNHLRVLRALRSRWREVQGKKDPSPRISGQDRARLFALWTRHKRVLGAALQMSKEIAEGDSLTGERMRHVVRALKHWVAVYGAAPRTLDAFPLELRDDGFGSPFFYEQSPHTVWLISIGGDGLRGTPDDRIWGLHR